MSTRGTAGRRRGRWFAGALLLALAAALVAPPGLVFADDDDSRCCRGRCCCAGHPSDTACVRAACSCGADSRTGSLPGVGGDVALLPSAFGPRCPQPAARVGIPAAPATCALAPVVIPPPPWLGRSNEASV